MTRSCRGRPLSDAARRAALDRWRASGLTQGDFCRREGIHPATFSGWKRHFAAWLATSSTPGDFKLAAGAKGAKAGVVESPRAFVEARVVDHPAEEAPSWIERVVEWTRGPLRALARHTTLGRTTGESGVEVVVNQHRIALARDFDVATLRQAIAALGSDTA